MRNFSVSSRGLPTVDVRAVNWLTALGEALRQLGRDDGLERLACEVLPNGTVIAREIRTGTGFVVQETPDSAPAEAAPPIEGVLQERLAAIAQARGRGPACDLALAVARETVPTESGAVLLEQKGFLEFVAAAGPHATKLVGLRLPLGTGVAGFCVEHRRSLVVDDASRDPRHSPDVDQLTGHRTRALFCVPITVDDRAIGVIELVNPPADAAISRQGVFDVQAIAHALGQRLRQLTA